LELPTINSSILSALDAFLCAAVSFAALRDGEGAALPGVLPSAAAMLTFLAAFIPWLTFLAAFIPWSSNINDLNAAETFSQNHMACNKLRHALATMQTQTARRERAVFVLTSSKESSQK
jgi:hypothetical protein